jgi:hypothetical protein
VSGPRGVGRGRLRPWAYRRARRITTPLKLTVTASGDSGVLEVGDSSLTRPESSLLMCTPFWGTVLTGLKRGRRPRTA